MHRDIKPTNILLVKNKENKYVVKLSDFGISKEQSESDPKTATTGVGTQGWRPREVIVPQLKARGNVSTYQYLLHRSP